MKLRLKDLENNIKKEIQLIQSESEKTTDAKIYIQLDQKLNAL